MKPLRNDPLEIARTLGILFQAEDVVELRVPKTEREGVVSGYFSDHAALAKCLAARNGDAGVYVTLNPVTPALLARAANRVRVHAKVTTADRDIQQRRWLLIDCDPVRPSEISSSDGEHGAALERARDIRRVLSEEGWPAPILADSGNGAHLLYRIDLPNDDASVQLLERLLKALKARFNDARVKVNETVFNAARIVKAYGTVTHKGDNMPERPHRLSRILETPPNLELVSYELLREVAPAATPPPHSKQSRGRFDIEAFLSRHLQARAPVAHEGGRKWVLEGCPFNPDHKAPDAAVFEWADGALGFKCFHDSCHEKTWKDVRARFEGPQYEPGRYVALSALPNGGGVVERLAPLAPEIDLLQFGLHDTGNSERIIALHGKDLRYSPERKKWLWWDGQRWVVDTRQAVRRSAKLTMVSFLKAAVRAGDVTKEKFAKASLNAKQMRDALSTAELELSVTLSELDQNPWLLNFQNGTLDLRDSSFRTHNRADFITKLVPHDFVRDAACPRWIELLSFMMNGRQELVDYVRCALGYSLAGNSREKAVFFLYGPSGTGKTTLLTTIREVLGEDYATLIQISSLFAARENNATNADLADLCGARFAMTSEPDPGSKLSPSKLKRLTQGMGKIKARRLYENPFSFAETHTLWCDCNDRPSIPNGDPATFARLNPIPCLRQIPKDEVDRTLIGKLRGEACGF